MNRLKIYGVLLLAAALCPLQGAVSSKVLEDGSIELANNFLKAKISPAKGGRVLSLTDLRSKVEYTGADWDMGIGGEMNWQERSLRASTYYGKPYAYQITKDADKVSIHFERNGSGNTGQWFTIHKTYTLNGNESELAVDYSIAVNPAAMSTLSFCLWLHNFATVKNEAADIKLVKKSGVTAIPFNSGSPRNESFHYDLADGWFAFARKKAPSGMIFQTPYQDLMCFYNWQGDAGTTMEILYRSQQIPAGKSYDTRMSVVLYDGIASPDGSGNGLVGAFTAKGAKIYAAKNFKGKIAVTTRKVPELLETPVKNVDLELKAGKTAEAAFAAGAAGLETIVRVISTDGKTMMTMRRPDNISNCTYTPEVPRRGNAAERFGQVILNSSERQDCYTWNTDLPITGTTPFLKPDAAGKIRLLAVTDMVCGREVIELANRMDADVSTCTFASAGKMGWHPVWGHSGGNAEANIYLAEALKKDYDVILLAGLQISRISKANLKNILKKVEKGTGFVSVMPSDIPSLVKGLFPAVPQIKECFQSINSKVKKSGAFKVAADSPVRNFPFEAMPEIYLFPYSAPKSVITSGNEPFLVTGKYGKGQTALFCWLSGRPDNTRHAGIMPYFASETSLPWHDTFYGMLIQTARWSMGRTPQVAVEKFSAESGKCQVVLNNRLGRKIEAELSFQAIHEGKKYPAITVTYQLKPGVNNLAIPLDYEYASGLNLLELRLKTGKLALDFAITAVNADSGAKIANLSVEDKLFPAGSPFTVSAELSGTYDSADCTLIDPDGRIIAKGEMQDGKCELTPRGVYSHRAEILLELKKQDKVIAGARRIVDLIPENEIDRSWQDYNVMLSWSLRGCNRAFPLYLQPVRSKALRELGVNLVLTYGRPVNWGWDSEKGYMLDYRYSGRLVMEGMAVFHKNSGLGHNYPNMSYRNRKAELTGIIENYAKTRNKMAIIRNPRFDDDKFLQSYSRALERRIPVLSRWKPLCYDLGDEMSYSEFNRAVDFDFAPEALASFRNWLKERYNNDLSKLNAEWKRSYSSWDEVIPDTGLEAKERKVFSSWALQRIHNTTLFAGFWKHVSDKVKDLDKGTLVSASGTPASHPYNGYDYELLLPAVDSLSAYTEPGVAELLNSLKKLPLSAWVGYGSGEKEIWYTIWNNAFNGHFGVSLYNEMILLNPDLTLTGRGKFARDAILPLRNGVGNLLYHSIKPADAAILYSIPSLMAAWADSTVNKYNDSIAAYLTILKQNKCNPMVITPKQLAAGEWTKNFKVLILPMALALSDGEAKVISDFAANGGIVLADVMPGKFNENVAIAKPGRIAGAVVAGKNFVPDLTNSAMKKAAKEVAAHLRKTGLPTGAKVLETVSGNPEISRFNLCPEGGQLFGVLNGAAGTVKITPPADGTVYAVLAKKAVSGNVKLQPYRPEVFVALPYKVKAVEAGASIADGVLSVSAGIVPGKGDALRHVFHFRVFDKNGRELEHFRRNAEAPTGRAEVKWNLALNETGAFMVEVTDVISGTKKTVEVK